jgi:hypothetical protein
MHKPCLGLHASHTALSPTQFFFFPWRVVHPWSPDARQLFTIVLVLMYAHARGGLEVRGERERERKEEEVSGHRDGETGRLEEPGETSDSVREKPEGKYAPESVGGRVERAGKSSV